MATSNGECIKVTFKDETPLLMAIRVNSYKCYNILLHYGADPEAMNSREEHEATYAINFNREEIIQQLLAKILSTTNNQISLGSYPKSLRTITSIY